MVNTKGIVPDPAQQLAGLVWVRWYSHYEARAPIFVKIANTIDPADYFTDLFFKEVKGAVHYPSL